jgi:hypothetical protein
VAAQMNALVIVTSAVESRFGIYNADQRLAMTLDTIKNLRERIPNVKIVVNEVSGNGLHVDKESALLEACDIFLDFTTNKEVNWIYNNPAWYDNWDIVKNLTELTTFPLSLRSLIDSDELNGIDRIFKMSGRYLLNEQFDIDFYSTNQVKDKIVIGKRVPSQFPFQVTQLAEQYMARLLSWPSSMHADMINYYVNARNYMRERMKAGGYADIEHCLFYALPKEHVLEVDQVGVYGTIAPNGHPIVN